jgi:hypothetical protein
MVHTTSTANEAGVTARATGDIEIMTMITVMATPTHTGITRTGKATLITDTTVIMVTTMVMGMITTISNQQVIKNLRK